MFYSPFKTVPVAENPTTPTELNEISTELMEKKIEENEKKIEENAKKIEENVEIQCEKSNGNTGNGELETEKLFENDYVEKLPALVENLNGISEDDKPVHCKTSTINSEPEIKSIEKNELKAANGNAANNTIEGENTNSNHLELCNGDIQEAMLDNTSNIDVPTPNEDADGVEGDFDFDQIYDDLQEKNKTSESNEQNDLKLSSASESNTMSDEKMETEKTTETNTANSVNDLDEDVLLKSPSMQENCEQDSELAKYSESMLLKEDSKDEIASDDIAESITILDSTDELMETSIIEKLADESEEVKEKNENKETENENENEQSMKDAFDQIKESKTVNETRESESTNRVDIALENVIEKSTNETEHLAIDIQDEDSVKTTETTDLPTLVAESSSDSLENKDNKENNLLEVMSGSPVSADNVESSSSSFRDDDVPNGDQFCDQAVDLKDENSTDARDGFNNDKSPEDVESNANKTESNDVSQLNENSVVSTEQMDSTESKIDVTKNLNEKSNESTVAISLDDDDDLIIEDSSSSEANKTSNEDDQPPAKRARMEITESEGSLSKPLESETLTCEEKSGNDEAVEAEKPGKLVNEKPEHSKVEEDDDIVIIESNESKASCEIVNANKRPASPVTIDAEDESSKKFKSDASQPIPTVDETKNGEPAGESLIIPQSETLDVVSETKEETKIEEPVESDTETDKTIMKDEQKMEIKIELKPKPEESVKRTIALDFAQKFKKGLNQMSRKNLEEFVLEKIIEAIVHKSDYSELKQRSEAQEKQIHTARTKLQEISKQYRDLEMVYARLKKDLENKNQNIVTPIKITRAVGLQVCLQKVQNKEASTAAATAPAPPKTIQKTYVTTAQTVTRAATVVASSAQSKVTPVQKQVTPVQRQPMRAIATRQATPEQRVVTTGRAIHHQNETLCIHAFLRRDTLFSPID